MILERRIVIQLLLNYLVGHPWHDAQQQNFLNYWSKSRGWGALPPKSDNGSRLRCVYAGCASTDTSRSHTNRSLAMSNRVSDVATWILKTADQRRAPETGWMLPTI